MKKFWIALCLVVVAVALVCGGLYAYAYYYDHKVPNFTGEMDLVVNSGSSGGGIVRLNTLNSYSSRRTAVMIGADQLYNIPNETNNYKTKNQSKKRDLMGLAPFL